MHAAEARPAMRMDNKHSVNVTTSTARVSFFDGSPLLGLLLPPTLNKKPPHSAIRFSE